MVTKVDARRETASLIGSDKVEGTAVYGPDDRKIGTVQRVMIDKTSGKVAYAVVSFGGFLGMGEDYYPMPCRIAPGPFGLDWRFIGCFGGLVSHQTTNRPATERLL